MVYRTGDPKEKQRAASIRYRNRHLDECRARRKAFYYAHQKEEVEAHRQYVIKNKDKICSYRKKRTNQIVIDVINSYGGKCACCGETNPLFLTLDHVNNDGNSHRKVVGSGYAMYEYAKRENYPDNLQILCFNCNFGKRRNKGVCPHNTVLDLDRI